jgi:adenosylcobinamide-GDP ribazoletransferase
VAALKREIGYFFAALGFFTRLPVPAWVGYSGEGLQQAARYLPAVGLLVGALAALVGMAAALLWPQPLAVLAAMATSLYVTGAFHEDGLSDMADGFGGGWTREQVLAIMKDSRVGSYGVIALVLALLGKFLALLELPAVALPAALVAGHAVSRSCAASLLKALDYARDEGASKARPVATRLSWGELLWVVTLGLLGAALLLPFLSPAAIGLGLLLALLATLWLARQMARRLGGYTGDCLGATQQVSELAFYLGLLCSL